MKSNLFLRFFALVLGAASGSYSLSLSEPEPLLQSGNCPDFWYSFNDRCFKYMSTRKTWAEAELYCVSEGANLVSIHSVEEHGFVRTLIRNVDLAQEWTWIGLSDIHKEGSWMWSDGSPVRFLDWAVGEPNSQGNEDCGLTNFETTKQWNDQGCLSVQSFVCATRPSSCL
uniref:C-type lectin domain-containing protein n=1 Tax=Cynoglossus semilaevis TaxID=244447 RepID=A0A3P8VSP6_CYNSE